MLEALFQNITHHICLIHGFFDCDVESVCQEPQSLELLRI